MVQGQIVNPAVRFSVFKAMSWLIASHRYSFQGPEVVPIIPLELLATGERARIADVDGDSQLVTRLNEIGLREGAEIKMVQSGSPCIIALDNHRLSFRGEEAALIFVETD